MCKDSTIYVYRAKMREFHCCRIAPSSDYIAWMNGQVYLLYHIRESGQLLLVGGISIRGGRQGRYRTLEG